jgi:polar amino acid transport system substrate-binding protein
LTVLFQRLGQAIPYTRLEDLSGLKAGTILGYRYCEELANGFFRTEEGQSLENNFRKLLRGRIDVVIENILVGRFIAHEMGITDQIGIVPGAFFCEEEANYLAFSRHSKYAALPDRFSQALRHFKTTEPYRLILIKYGLERGSPAIE